MNIYDKHKKMLQKKVFLDKNNDSDEEDDD